MRTTIDIDDPVLAELKRLQKQENKSLGRLVSELLAVALKQMNAVAEPPPAFNWHSQPMDARINLADKDAVFDAMDEPGSKTDGQSPHAGTSEDNAA